MKRWPLTFALLLPMAELCVWFLMLTVPALQIFLNLEMSARGSDVAHLQFGDFSQTIPRSDFLSYATRGASFRNSHALTALNMPGLFGEILISLPTSWPGSWHPNNISIDSWRALIIPVFCLPAWLLVGSGFDSLLGWRRLHWTALLTGSLLCIFFAVLFAELSFGVSKSERGEIVFPLWGLAFWTILFASLPVAWVRQWRAKRADRRRQDQAVTTGTDSGSPPTSVSASS